MKKILFLLFAVLLFSGCAIGANKPTADAEQIYYDLSFMDGDCRAFFEENAEIVTGEIFSTTNVFFTERFSAQPSEIYTDFVKSDFSDYNRVWDIAYDDFINGHKEIYTGEGLDKIYKLYIDANGLVAVCDGDKGLIGIDILPYYCVVENSTGTLHFYHLVFYGDSGEDIGFEYRLVKTDDGWRFDKACLVDVATTRAAAVNNFKEKAVNSRYYALVSRLQWDEGEIFEDGKYLALTEMITHAYMNYNGKEPDYTMQGDLPRLPVSFLTEYGEKYYGFDSKWLREYVANSPSYNAENDTVASSDGLGSVNDISDTAFIIDKQLSQFEYHYTVYGPDIDYPTEDRYKNYGDFVLRAVKNSDGTYTVISNTKTNE